MEFQEVFMSPLTTATTCYSGAKRNKGGDDGQTLRLATEANLLGIRWGQKVWNTDAMETTSEIIKSSSSSSRSKTICVGFSQWNDESYALALVDSSQMTDSSSKHPNVNSKFKIFCVQINDISEYLVVHNPPNLPCFGPF